MYYLYMFKEPTQKLFLVSVDYNNGLLKFSKDLSTLNLLLETRERALDVSLKIQKEFELILSIDKKEFYNG